MLSSLEEEVERRIKKAMVVLVVLVVVWCL